MRFLLYLLWSFISLLVIVLVVVTILLTVYNDELETRIVQKIELYTERNIAIEGGFEFRINPRPTFYAKDIKMANARWADEPWMLEIGVLSASLSVAGLLRGDIDLENVEAKDVNILVEQSAVFNQVNWQFESQREPKVFKKLAKHLHIQNAKIENAQININIGQVEHIIEVDVITGQTHYFSEKIDIQAFAQLHDRPIELELELDNLKKMFLREPTKLHFNGQHGLTRIKGQGEIRDLMSWKGHDIKLEIDTPSLDEVQAWVSTTLIKTPPVSASAQFIQDKKWATAKFDDINVLSKGGGLQGQTTITGKVAQLKDWKGIELAGKSHYPLASVIRWKGLESNTDAVLDASYTISGNKQDALAFEVQSASLLGEGIQVNGGGKIADILQPDSEGIVLSVHVDSLHKVGLFNARKWFKTGVLDGTVELMKRQGKLALDNIDLKAFDGRTQLTGKLDDLSKTQLGDFTFAAKLLRKDIALINRLNDRQYPAFEETSINAKINTERTDMFAPSANLSLRSDGLQISADGEISDLKTLSTTNTAVSFKADSIAKINQQFDTSFPELGVLMASGTATGSIDNLFNINIKQATINNQHQQFSATGKLQSLGPKLQADLSIKANIESIENLPELLQTQSEVFGQFTAVGVANLNADGYKDWSFTDIKLVVNGLNQGTISGSALHIPEAIEYALLADMQRIALESLPENQLINTLAPENIRIYTEINKSAEAQNFSLNNIDGLVNLAEGSASVNFAGDISNINQFTGLSLSLGVSASELKLVPFISYIPLKPGISGVASVNLTGSPDDLDIQISSLKAGETSIKGKLNVRSEKDSVPRIKGKLSSDNLDVLALIQQGKRKRMFSKEPLQLGWLNDFNAELDLRAARFNGIIAELNDAIIKIQLEDGVLNMPNTNGKIGDGNMQIWLTLVAQREPYNIIGSIKGENIKPEFINLFGESEFIRGGTVDIDIGLGGVGASIANYMDNAYGKIQLQLHDSSIKNKNLKLFGEDLVTGVLDIINPFSRQAAYLPIVCGVIHFPVVKGDAIAAQGIAIKTDKVTVLGGGAIDLGTEELEILIKPKARKGLGLSAGLVTNIAKISGNFARPKISIDSSSLLQTTASIGAAIFSGGWTLLAQGLLDRNMANSDVCGQTLREPNKTFIEQAKDKARGFGFRDR